MAVEVGEKAPGFALPSDDWANKVSLESRTEEGTVVLFGRAGDWSSVCTGQMDRLQAEMGRNEERGARALAVSVDTPWSHKAFAEDRGIEFPLLSDFRREVIEEYGVEHEGVVRAKKVEPSPKDQPEIGEVLEDLRKAL